MSTLAPVGDRDLRAGAGDYELIADRLGGALRELRFRGLPLLDGYGTGELPDAGRGQVLAPWPNRLRDGRWSWEGMPLQLPIDEPAKGNSALHGLVRWQWWTVDGHGSEYVRLGFHLAPSPGYPFPLLLEAEYRLDAEEGLDARVSATNVGARPAPVALGAHPYLLPPAGARLEDTVLTMRAGQRLTVDEHGAPDALEPVAGGRWDFSSGRVFGSTVVNHSFTGLTPEPSGQTVIRLEAPGGRVTFRTDAAARWVHLYSGDALPVDRRRRSLAVEPMTAPPGALASKAGLTVLAPRETLSLRWGLRAG